DRNVTGVQTCALPILQLHDVYMRAAQSLQLIDNPHFPAGDEDYPYAQLNTWQIHHPVEYLALYDGYIGCNHRFGNIHIPRKCRRSEERRVGKEDSAGR